MDSAHSTALTKITRPVAAGLVPRPRLFRQLDEGRDQQLIWVSGPGGAGKTSLVSSYVEERGLRSLWFQIDSGDSDLATFFHYLGLAGKKAAPRKKRALPALTPEYLLDVAEFSRSFFEELCQRVRAPAVLVFDNCQLVSDEAPLFAALLEGQNRLPPEIQLILLSRNAPPPCFARLRANRQLQEMAWEDLKLSFDEFEEIAGAWKARAWAPEALKQLHHGLDGWAAGLRLVLESGEFRRIAPGELRHAAQETLFEYFSGEVFDQLDEEEREFLLETSVLPSMTPRIAEALTGSARAARILSALHRRNHFTERRVGSASGYQYHPLFRDFLEARAQRQLRPEKLSQLRRRGAQLLREAEQPDAAAALLQQAQDWPALVEVILERAAPLLEQGRNQTLAGWIGSLPGGLVDQDPWLQHWLGASHMPMNTAEAYACFERSFELFRKSGDNAGTLLAWAGAVGAIQWGFENLHEAKPWLRLLSELIPGPEALPPGEVGARVVASAYSVIATSQSDHPDFSAWEHKALEVARHSPDPGSKLQIIFYATPSALCRGDIAMAEGLIAMIRQVMNEESWPPFTRLQAIFPDVHLQICLAHYARALELVEQGLALGAASGVRVLDFMLLGNGTFATLALGQLDRARQYLGRMEELLPFARPWDRAFFQYQSARLALAEGDLSRADALAQLALEQVIPVGVPAPELTGHLLRADIAHELGDLESAAHHLALAKQIAEEFALLAFQPCCLMHEAHFLLSRGEEEAGVGLLRKALGQGPRCTWPNYMRREVLASLLARALAEGIEQPYVGELIRRFELTPPPDTPFSEAWPWPLRIYTLGRFELLRDDEPLRTSGRGQRKPLELLQLLIALGGREVSEIRLSLELWPDADGDLAHRSFATTLHRLRKLLDVKDAIELRENRVSLNPHCCWIDTWALEQMLDDAESSWARATGKREGEGEGANELVRRALALYQGPFLDQEAWSIAMRERLRSKLLRGVEVLGRQLERSRRFEEAIECYQRVLEGDPLVESLYQRVMTCYGELGRVAEALASYDRCRDLLERTFGVVPCQETELLRKALMGSNRSRTTSG